MRKPDRKHSRNRHQKNQLTFDKLDERKLLAGDLIQPIQGEVSVDQREEFLQIHFEMGQHDSLREISVIEDHLGFTHYKYQQLHHDTPVDGGVFTVHAREDRLLRISGDYVSVSDRFVGPRLDSDSAFDVALNHVDAETFIWSDQVQSGLEGVTFEEASAGELVYYTPENGTPTLAYKFDVFAIEPFSRDYIFVDARTGTDVLGERNRIAFVNDPATGVALYDGNVDIVANRLSATDWRLEQALPNRHDAGGVRNIATHTVTIPGLIQSADNTFDDPGMEAGVQAHYSSETFYDYFYFVHGRSSYDGMDAELTTVVNDPSAMYFNNAVWTGSTVRIGTPDGTTRDHMVALDIIGHEFTHGVIENSANFFLSNQSGAIAESYADIFGTAVERYARNRLVPTWTIGEDVPQGGAATWRLV